MVNFSRTSSPLSRKRRTIYATLADSIVHMGQYIPWTAIGWIVRLVTLVHKYQPPAQLELVSILLGFHRLRLLLLLFRWLLQGETHKKPKEKIMLIHEELQKSLSNYFKFKWELYKQHPKTKQKNCNCMVTYISSHQPSKTC